MISHYPMTVQSLIDTLDAMPADTTVGLAMSAGSYRGYYEHVGIEEGKSFSESLSLYLKGLIGTTMHGWKGGDYTFRGDSYVFVADHGYTGLALCGFSPTGEPIGVESRYFG